jgi:L-alanine-DL-glutamate epimerase-like enolase superfamily enzyme
MQGPRIDAVECTVIDVPTERRPETDGTARWSSTTMVLAHVRAGGVEGIGYSYVSGAAATLIRETLGPAIEGGDAYATPALAIRMMRAIRNHGQRGIGACAVSAVDIALWDLRAKLLDVPVSLLFGTARDSIPVYASGGFTSTPHDELADEIERYVDAGYTRIKIKVGQPVHAALERIALVRQVAGPHIALMIDGNGAYDRKEALRLAASAERYGVSYFEEPVSSDDLAGLRAIRDHISLDIAAGEYGYDTPYFRDMLAASAVDILQADATRCRGFSGFLQADALCDAFGTPLSAHCAPALHVHVARASRRLVHVEHFYDHVRIENMLFDGAPVLEQGALVCDWRRSGLGLALRAREAKRFAA